MMEQKTDFESAVKRLEEIVRLLENGDAPLDKLMDMYEEAVGLTKLCNKLIADAEKKIKVLVDDGAGGKVKENFVSAEG